MSKSSDIVYDDSQLQQMFADLQPKQRVRALKSAVLKGGNKVKQASIGALRSKVNSNRSLERGIRVLAFKEKVGFRVTIGTPKGSKKPARTTTTTDLATGKKSSRSTAQDRSYILRFFEASKGSVRHHRTGKKSSTGVLEQVQFMEAGRAAAEGEVNEEIQAQFRQNIINIAQKHGCKTN